MVDVKELKDYVESTLKCLNSQTVGFTSDHEVGYHEGMISAYESILEIINT